jgi:hypothetical protein
MISISNLLKKKVKGNGKHFWNRHRNIKRLYKLFLTKLDKIKGW